MMASLSSTILWGYSFRVADDWLGAIESTRSRSFRNRLFASSEHPAFELPRTVAKRTGCETIRRDCYGNVGLKHKRS